MYTGSNPSALRSKKWLSQAFLELLKTKNYSKISVKDICTQADLSRQTFYQIFSSKEEIMEYHFSVLFEEFTHRCSQYPTLTISDISYCFFQFFFEHKVFTEIIIQNHLTSFLEQQFEHYIRHIELFQYYSKKEEHTDYTAAFLSGALTQLLVHWFRNDFDLSIDTISSVAFTLLTGYVFQRGN